MQWRGSYWTPPLFFAVQIEDDLHSFHGLLYDFIVPNPI